VSLVGLKWHKPALVVGCQLSDINPVLGDVGIHAQVIETGRQTLSHVDDLVEPRRLRQGVLVAWTLSLAPGKPVPVPIMQGVKSLQVVLNDYRLNYPHAPVEDEQLVLEWRLAIRLDQQALREEARWHRPISGLTMEATEVKRQRRPQSLACLLP